MGKGISLWVQTMFTGKNSVRYQVGGRGEGSIHSFKETIIF